MKKRFATPNVVDCKEQTSENILKSTIECFHEYGVEKAKVTEIARRAGVTSKTVYRHFKSKDALASAACAYFWGCMLYGISDIDTVYLNYPNMSGYEIIMSILEKKHEMYLENIKYFRIFSQTLDCMYRNKTIVDTDAMWLRKSVPYYHLVQKGIKDGSIRPDLDPVRASALIWTTYISVAQMLSSMSYMEDETHVMYEKNIFADAQDMISRYLNR